MDAQDKLRHSMDLMELGFEMHKQNLRRRHPEWSEEQILEAFEQWLVDRPMDAPGDEEASSS